MLPLPNSKTNKNTGQNCSTYSFTITKFRNRCRRLANQWPTAGGFCEEKNDSGDNTMSSLSFFSFVSGLKKAGRRHEWLENHGFRISPWNQKTCFANSNPIFVSASAPRRARIKSQIRSSLLPDAFESSPRCVRLCSQMRSSLLPRSQTSIELENGAKRLQSVALSVGNCGWGIRGCQRKEGLAYGFTFDRSFRIVIWLRIVTRRLLR